MQRLNWLDSTTEGPGATQEVVDPGGARLAQRGALLRLRDDGANRGGFRLRADKPGIGVPDLEADVERRAVQL